MEEIYWIWISRLQKISKATMLKLLQKYKTPEKIYNLNSKELLENEINQKEIQEIQKIEYKQKNEEYLQYMKQNNIEIISIANEYYPNKLKNISDPPIVLFIKGNKKILNQKAIAIVRMQGY